MAKEEKYIGESQVNSTPQKKFGFKLKDGSVTTEKIADGSVTSEKIGDDVAETLVDPKILALKEYVQAKIDEIWDVIDSAAHEGPYFEQTLGNKEHMGISQKCITDNINDIWSMFSTITGSGETELTMTVNPTYFDDDTCEIHISASTNGPTKFDNLKFLVNDNVVYNEDNVDSVDDFTTTVSDSCTIKCDATILGKTYHAERRISKYAELWIGGGTTYQDVMIDDYRNEITDGKVKGNYDVTVDNNDFIFIIMSNSLAATFNKAEMDGFEIPFTRYGETPIGYVCFKSANTYIGGTYNIDLE